MTRFAAPILAALFCLVAATLVLAALPAVRPETGDEPARPYGFSEKLAVIARRTWERVLLPRPPAREAGYRNWVQTFQRTAPLLLTGLAVTVAFRAGVLNIGAQGQYVVGAIAGTAVALHLRGPAGVLVPVYVVAAAAAGGALAAAASALERWRRVPVVLSTLLLNFVALEFLRYLLQGPMRAGSEGGALLDPQSEALPLAGRLYEFFAPAGSWGEGVHLGLFLAVGAAVAVGFVLSRTTFGFRVRAVGLNPDAARFAGMAVPRVAAASLALSGALAGVGGAVQVAGAPSYVLFPDLGVDGVGFTGIAVALLARLSPVGVIFSALFFGLLSTTFKALETSDLDIHSSTAQAVQGALIIALLVATSPRLLTMTFRRGKGRADRVGE